MVISHIKMIVVLVILGLAAVGAGVMVWMLGAGL